MSLSFLSPPLTCSRFRPSCHNAPVGPLWVNVGGAQNRSRTAIANPLVLVLFPLQVTSRLQPIAFLLFLLSSHPLFCSIAGARARCRLLFLSLPVPPERFSFRIRLTGPAFLELFSFELVGWSTVRNGETQHGGRTALCQGEFCPIDLVYLVWFGTLMVTLPESR